MSDNASASLASRVSDDAFELGATEVGASQVRSRKTGVVASSSPEARVGKVGPAKTCTSVISPVKTRANQITPLKIGLPEVDLDEIRAFQLCALESCFERFDRRAVGIFEIRVLEIPRALGAPKYRTLERYTPEYGVGKSRA